MPLVASDATHGNLGADLRVLSRDIVDSLQDQAIRTAFASIVAAAVPDLATRDMLARFIAARAATMAVIVNRAVERGEVPPGTNAAEVIQIVMARSTTGCSPRRTARPGRGRPCRGDRCRPHRRARRGAARATWRRPR